MKYADNIISEPEIDYCILFLSALTKAYYRQLRTAISPQTPKRLVLKFFCVEGRVLGNFKLQLICTGN
jgi:hypothetical protein